MNLQPGHHSFEDLCKNLHHDPSENRDGLRTRIWEQFEEWSTVSPGMTKVILMEDILLNLSACMTGAVGLFITLAGQLSGCLQGSPWLPLPPGIGSQSQLCLCVSQ